MVYRILKSGETILPTDEALAQDCGDWVGIGESFQAGVKHDTNVFMPIRRKLSNSEIARMNLEAERMRLVEMGLDV